MRPLVKVRELARSIPWLHRLVHRFRLSRAYGIVRWNRARRSIRRWNRSGRPLPAPSEFKYTVVKRYAKQYGLRTLVETGTYHGGLIYATSRLFDQIISIELDEGLYRRAVGAFKRFKRFSHVTLLQGDSAVMLPRILSTLNEPAVFWLDAHYSGPGTGTARAMQDTPIEQELACILDHPLRGHVVLIDDAREFVGRNDYPSLAEVERLIHQRRPEWTMSVEHDIIRLHVRESL